MSSAYGGSPRTTHGRSVSTTRVTAARSRAVSRRSAASRPPCRPVSCATARQALAKIDRALGPGPHPRPVACAARPRPGQRDAGQLAAARTPATSFGRFVITQQALIGGTGAFEPADVSVPARAVANAAAPQAEDPETDLFYGAAGQIPPIIASALGDRVVLRSARARHRAQPVRGEDDHGRRQLRCPVRDRGHAAVVCRADLLRPRPPRPAPSAGPARADGLAAQGARASIRPRSGATKA